MINQYEELKKKIINKKSKICVIGLGQVGLPTALSFVNSGYFVTGVDINSEIINKLSNGIVSFKEENLEEILKEGIKNNKFFVGTEIHKAVKNSDILIVCVATPVTNNIRPDLTSLESVCDSLLESNLNNKLIIIESSLPPGTFEGLIMPLRNTNELCWISYVPERLLPGHAFTEIKTTPRIIGKTNDESGILSLELYKTIVKSKIILTSFKIAEISKLVENTYRDVNIAFANEVGLICEKYGVDFNELSQVCNTHPRVNLHQPGPGVGGPCLPKDPYLLLNPFGAERIKSKIIVNARKINDNMPKHVFYLIDKALSRQKKKMKESVIAVLGTAYKSNVSDTRFSPTEKIVKLLLESGSSVKINDPHSEINFGGKYNKNIMDTIKRSDLVVIVTDHDEYKNLNLNDIKNSMKKNPILVDTKRIFNKEIAQDLGFVYIAIGCHSLNDKID